MYKPGAINHADALIKYEQDLDDQTATKISLQTQTLLQPKHLNLWIQAELKANSLGTKLCPIDFSELNFINKLLQANCTAPSLQKHHKKAKNVASP